MAAIGITALVALAGIVCFKVTTASARKRPLLPKSDPANNKPGPDSNR